MHSDSNIIREDNFHLFKVALVAVLFTSNTVWFLLSCLYLTTVTHDCVNNQVGLFLIGLFTFITSLIVFLSQSGLFLLLSVLWYLGNPFVCSTSTKFEETSDSHPFHVDMLDDVKIGMSIAPGRKKGVYYRDLRKDLLQIRDNYKIDVIITLLQDSDMKNIQISDLPSQAESLGTTFI